MQRQGRRHQRAERQHQDHQGERQEPLLALRRCRASPPCGRRGRAARGRSPARGSARRPGTPRQRRVRPARAPASPGRPRCRRGWPRARRSRRWRAGRGSGTWCRRWTGRRRGRGRRAGGRARRAGCRARPGAPAASNEAGASRVTAKNSPIGRLNRLGQQVLGPGRLGLPLAAAPDVEEGRRRRGPDRRDRPDHRPDHQHHPAPAHQRPGESVHQVQSCLPGVQPASKWQNVRRPGGSGASGGPDR